MSFPAVLGLVLFAGLPAAAAEEGQRGHLSVMLPRELRRLTGGSKEYSCDDHSAEANCSSATNKNCLPCKWRQSSNTCGEVQCSDYDTEAECSADDNKLAARSGAICHWGEPLFGGSASCTNFGCRHYSTIELCTANANHAVNLMGFPTACKWSAATSKCDDASCSAYSSQDACVANADKVCGTCKWTSGACEQDNSPECRNALDCFSYAMDVALGVLDPVAGCTNLKKGKMGSGDVNTEGCFEYYVNENKKEQTRETCGPQDNTDFEQVERCVCEPGTDLMKVAKCMEEKSVVSSAISRFGAGSRLALLAAFTAALYRAPA